MKKAGPFVDALREGYINEFMMKGSRSPETGPFFPMRRFDPSTRFLSVPAKTLNLVMRRVAVDVLKRLTSSLLWKD